MRYIAPPFQFASGGEEAVVPYVMVPVPEEHVEEAMQAVLNIIRRAQLTDWDADSVADFFGEIDEAAKTLLSVAARAQLADKQLTQVAAADAVQLTQREVMGIMRELNEQARERARPPLLVHQEATKELPNGRTRTVAVIATSSELATMIRDAERAELAAGPNPLSGLEP